MFQPADIYYGNEYVHTIDTNQYFQQFGYQFLKHFILRYWLRFAGDAAAIARQERENQTLLNAFNRRCTWSHMIIKVKTKAVPEE